MCKTRCSSVQNDTLQPQQSHSIYSRLSSSTPLLASPFLLLHPRSFLLPPFSTFLIGVLKSTGRLLKHHRLRSQGNLQTSSAATLVDSSPLQPHAGCNSPAKLRGGQGASWTCTPRGGSSHQQSRFLGMKLESRSPRLAVGQVNKVSLTAAESSSSSPSPSRASLSSSQALPQPRHALLTRPKSQTRRQPPSPRSGCLRPPVHLPGLHVQAVFK